MSLRHRLKHLPRLFILCLLTRLTHPKTQRLIDRFDIYNARGDNDNFKNRNELGRSQTNDVYGDTNNNNNNNVLVAVGKNWQNNHHHPAQVPLVIPPKLPTCDSPLINGRMRTTCSGKDLKQVPRGIPLETAILHLESNQLTQLSARAFIDLSSLQSLYLNNNAISHVDVDAFAGLINLSELDLSHNKLKNTPSSIFRDFTHLQVPFHDRLEKKVTDLPTR